MGVSAGPKTVTDGLVFALDARNTKTYGEIPGITDHGISDWYCFISGTATYSAIYSNTEIIEIDENGNETVLVTTGSDPQRGTFSTTAGRRYYGTKAVHLLQTTASDDQHELAPVSFAGTYFAHRWTRNSPTTYYAYAPQDDTTLEFFDNNAAGGVTGSVTATHTISRGFTTSFQSTAQGTWQFFKADKPIIMTAGGTGWDKTILAPATQYVYTRLNANEITINNTTPSGIGNNVIFDTSLPVAHVQIADGAGGDCTQGIGYEYLSDTYSWGDLLSDFSLVSPYANNVVNVSYWENNQWNLGGSYSLDGTQTNPAVVFRNGNGGFDSAATGTNPYSGAHSNFNTSTLWKFEGTSPFSVIINDNADDEERLLGWMSNKYLRTSSNVTQSFVNLIDKDDRSRMKLYGKDLTTTIEYAGAKLSAGDYIEFDGSDDYITETIDGFNPDSGCTLETFVRRPTIPPAWRTYFNIKPNSGSNTPFFEMRASGAVLNVRANYYNGTDYSTSAYTINSTDFYHMIATYDGAGNINLYINGSLYNTKTSVPSFAIGANPIITIGRAYSNNRPTNIEVGVCRVYNKALTASEIQQNFNATRGRFGI
jgi:hypothetical protein